MCRGLRVSLERIVLITSHVVRCMTIEYLVTSRHCKQEIGVSVQGVLVRRLSTIPIASLFSMARFHSMHLPQILNSIVPPNISRRKHQRG